MRTLLVFATLCVAAHAHICMWAPLQRSAFAINAPGSDPCYLKPGPCGGIPYAATNPVTKLPAGQLFSVQFQQNLNHYYVQNPGYLEVSLAQGTNPAEGDFQRIGPIITDFNGMDMITQTNFTITIPVPSTPCTQCVLRTRYLSNNPLENDRGEVFHQCADVQIVSAENDAEAAANIAKEVAATDAATTAPHTVFVLPHAARVASKRVNPGLEDPAGCCTLNRQWATEWEETGSYRQSTNGVTYYDAVNSLMRVDTNSGSGTTIYDGEFTHFCNFTSGIEYYLNRVTGVCEPLGLDYWNNWCYGPNNNQSESYTESITLGETTVNIWQNGEFFFGGTADANCQPVLLTRPTRGAMTLYYNFAPGIPDPTVFQAPPQCHLALSEAMAANKPLRRAPVDPRYRDRYAHADSNTDSNADSNTNQKH